MSIIIYITWPSLSQNIWPSWAKNLGMKDKGGHHLDISVKPSPFPKCEYI